MGAGMMGTALCVPLADRGHDVRLIGTPLDDAAVGALTRSHIHPGLGCGVPAGIRAFPVSALDAACADADAIVVGVSSAGLGWAAFGLSVVALFERRPLAYHLINGGYLTIAFVVMGLILALWR